MEKYFGEKTPKLGFGLMRLPTIGEDIDIEQTKKMVDMFMEAGMTYFDTAFVYGNDGASEKAAKAALIDRYPRDSFTIATKLNAWLGCHDEQSAKQEFYTSLERLGTDYVDYYLLHALQQHNYDLYDKYGIWDFVKDQKEKGRIKHWGFSFHASSELLDQILTEHPDAEFVQLQLNYADWENPDVQSRRCYEVARKHGKSIVVMEPVKGGALADPPQPVQDILSSADPNASMASWAIRYAASLDGILTVLSGMSNIEQMADNLSYMKDFKPMTAEENAVVLRAQEALSKIEQIPCTGCHYCTDGCPMNIPIPEIFSARNRQLVWKKDEWGQNDYNNAVKERGKASECIKCGQCMTACPQSISVIDWLENCSEVFDK